MRQVHCACHAAAHKKTNDDEAQTHHARIEKLSKDAMAEARKTGAALHESSAIARRHTTRIGWQRSAEEAARAKERIVKRGTNHDEARTKNREVLSKHHNGYQFRRAREGSIFADLRRGKLRARRGASKTNLPDAHKLYRPRGAQSGSTKAIPRAATSQRAAPANGTRLTIQRALLAAGGSNGGVCRLSRHLRAIVKVALRSKRAPRPSSAND